MGIVDEACRNVPPDSPHAKDDTKVSVLLRRRRRRLSDGPVAIEKEPMPSSSSMKALTGSSKILERPPKLYRHAKEQAWEKVASDCLRFPREASYVSPDDGTTALHLVVMSIVGYSISESEPVEHPAPAPLALVECLLQVCPESAKIVCQINSYTPLAYACLVTGEDCYLEDNNGVVRLFLKYCPECTSILTAGGLSVVDVHIVSYSQAMSGREEEGTHLSGRTSTVVLRTLLENNPGLAQVRISCDKVGGPIEILYRCNSQAFLKLVAQYENKESSPDRARAKSGDTDDNRKSVIAQISQWWVWRWNVMILKYSTLPRKKKGARFLALQAAAGLVGCPLPILVLALSVFPDQIKAKDETHGNDGNLPLHSVCSWPSEKEDSVSTDPVIASRKSMAISALLQRYPYAAFICNQHYQTPLDLAIASGTTWDGGVCKLVRAYPAAVSIRNADTGLYPFMAAAAAAASYSAENNQVPSLLAKRSLMTHSINMAKRDLQVVQMIYGLLRADPAVLRKEDADDALGDQRSHGWAKFADITNN